MEEIRKKSRDPLTEYFLPKVYKKGIDLIWDRYEASQPICGFGDLGLCCHDCLQGPCRIDPFKRGIKKGICGRTADDLALSWYSKALIIGAGHRANYALEMLLLLRGLAQERLLATERVNREKLNFSAQEVNLETKGKEVNELASELAGEYLKFFFNTNGSKSSWLEETLPGRFKEAFSPKKILPSGILGEIANSFSTTELSFGGDPADALLNSFGVCIASLLAMHLAAEFQEAFFGDGSIKTLELDLSSLLKDNVNIALVGDINPKLVERLTFWSKELRGKAKDAGVKDGILLHQVCETMPLGIPPLLWANYGSQEMVILTGALETLLIGSGCVSPGIILLLRQFHTKLVRVTPLGDASNLAKKILEEAIENFKNRKSYLLDVPDIREKLTIGFNQDSIVSILSKINRTSPLKVITDSIRDNSLLGVALVAGCNNVRQTQDEWIVSLAEELLKNNVLCLTSGCAGVALGKAGFLNPENKEKFCGENLNRFLSSLEGFPPVLYMGSCGETVRSLELMTALVKRANLEMTQFPFVAIFPELSQERALVDAFSSVALGIPTFISSVIPIWGSEAVSDFISKKMETLLGTKLNSGPELPELKGFVLEIVNMLKRRREGLKA